MFKKSIKTIISFVLVLVLISSLIPASVFAYTYSEENIRAFSNESGITFVICEKDMADGTRGKVVATFENGEITWLEQCNPSTDYYIHLSMPRDCGEKYLMLSTGVHEDGRPVGTTYENIPGKVGSTITPRELDKTDVLESIVYYQDDPDIKYGMNSKHEYYSSYKAVDGTVIYKIRKYNGTDPNGTIDVSLGISLDGYIYDNAESIFEGLHISIGDYDEENHIVVADEGYEQSISYENIVQKSELVSSANSGISMILDTPSITPQSFAIARNSAFLYNSIEFDFVVPQGVEINNMGFSSSMIDYDSNAGAFSVENKGVDSQTGATIYHVTFSEGKKESSGIGFNFQPIVKSSTYKIGDSVTFEVKNAVAKLSDHESMDITGSTMKVTVIDGGSDDTKLTSGDRTVYNSTIDTDEHYQIELARGIVNKPSPADSPFDKIYEAKFNVNNADAKITTIVIPKGRNDEPTIEVTGIDENGEEITVIIDNPNRYILKACSNSNISEGISEYDFSYVIPASDLGMTDIKSAKANIGKVKQLYNKNTSGASTTVTYEYNAGGAYGYFTTPNSGIQVVSEFRLYNENPAYRAYTNGDLSSTSTYTSTDIKTACIKENSTLTYYYNNNKDYTYMSWFKGETDENGNLIVSKAPSYDASVSYNASNKAPSIDPGMSLTMSSDLIIMDSATNFYKTYDTDENVVLNKTKLPSEKSTVLYLADPVFYLTLPADFEFKDIAFQLEEKKIVLSENFKSGIPLFPESIWPYLYDNVKANTFVVTKNLECLVENITYKNTTGDGRNIYKITFPNNDASMGYYAADNTMRAIKYAVQIGTSKSSTTTRYPLSDLMQISAENPLAGAMNGYTTSISSTSSINYTVKDRYDVNNGDDLVGVTYGPFITGRLGETRDEIGFQLQKLSEVSMYNYCRVTKIDNKPVEQEWYTYIPKDGNSIALLGAKSEGQYKLVINNADVTHATKKLQAVVPIPKKGANMGTAFMEEEMQFDMTFTWDEDSIPEGYTYQYIEIESIDSEDIDTEGFTYTESDKEHANAILIETESLGAGAEVEFIFDFVIGEDAQQQDLNIFYNAVRYTDFTDLTQGKIGSKIAVEVAKGKISGIAFYDENRNGKLDEDEERLSGINVRVVDSTGKFQYVTTDENGFYEFNAVREKDINVTYTVDKSSRYRMNIETPDLTLNSNHLSATAHFSSLVEEEVDIPLDKYVTLSYVANPPTATTATGDIPKTQEYFIGQEATVSAKPDNLKVPTYQFVNWNTKADGTGTAYNANANFTITEDTVLYAQWEPQPYTITFDYSGGSVAHLDDDALKYYCSLRGLNYNELNEIFEASGNKDNDIITIPYYPGLVDKNGKFTQSTIRDAIAMYYGFDKDSNYFNNTINSFRTKKMFFMLPGSNDQNAPIDSGSYKYDVNLLLTEKNGYDAREFIDDYDGKTYSSHSTTYSPWYFYNSSGKKIRANLDTRIAYTYFDKNNNLTLHLNWRPKEDFTVEYDTDGGSEIESDENVSWEENINDLSNAKVPTKPSYTFSHWEFEENKLTATDTYGSLAVEDTVKTITLKAVYDSNDYIVNYNSNGGTDVPSRTVTFNQDNLNALTIPTKANSVFRGWSTDNSEENIIDSTQTYSDLVEGDATVESITLYAIWSDKSGYTVEFNTNGGTVVTDKTNLTFNDANLISGAVTTKPGYEFDCWTYQGEKVTDDTTYGELAKSEEVSTITLDANWTAVDYTIQYTNVVDPIDDKTGVHWEDNKLIPDANPNKKGYTFKGWTYGTTSVNNSTTVESLNPSSTTLVMKANWDNIKYMVEYDSDGGTIVNPLLNQTIDSSNLLPQTPVTKNGFVLEGWYDENGNKVSQSTQIGDIVIGDSTSVLLTAHWTAKTGYTVTYDLNGGNIDGSQTIDDKSVAWTDKNLIPDKTPVRTGYNFMGWMYNTKQVDSNTSYDYLAVFDSVTTISLVAKWEKKPIEVKIIGATLYLGDKTGVNFYVDFGAEVTGSAPNYVSTLDLTEASKYKMHFTMKDSEGKTLATETVPFDADSLTFMNVKGEIRPLYKYTHWSLSYEMADTIEATVYKGTDSVTDTKSYSVLTYANNMLGRSSTDNNLKDCLKGMLVYGAEAQKYWSHNLGLLSTSSTYLSSEDKNINSVDLSKYAPVKKENIDGISNLTLALKIKDGTGFDMKFGITANNGIYLNELKTATLSSKTVPTIKKNGKDVSVISTNPFNLLPEIKEAGDHVVSYQMTIEDIPVFRWEDEFTVKLNNALGSEYSVTYSLLTYGYVINGSGNKEENLLRSMAKYNEMSENYFKDIE